MMIDFLENEIIKTEKRIKNNEERLLIDKEIVQGLHQSINLLRKQQGQEQEQSNK